MTQSFKYIVPMRETHWNFPASGEVSFTWDYDARSDELLKLYSKGKKEQWDAEQRIDWSLPVDPEDPMQMDDQVVPLSTAETLADWTNGALTIIDGGGHAPHARHPVPVNLLLRDFVHPRPPSRSTWQPIWWTDSTSPVLALHSWQPFFSACSVLS